MDRGSQLSTLVVTVGIRCIENKKFPTARTQSKPRCNLEDGSNEGVSSLTLEEIPKPTR